MNIKKLLQCLLLTVLLLSASCKSNSVPVLRVADFNMPNTYFELFDNYDTKDYVKPKIIVETEPIITEPPKPTYRQPAERVEITLGGNLTIDLKNFEYNLISGNAYFDIIVSGTEWERDVGSDPKLTQELIDSMEGSLMWTKLVRSKLNTENVIKLSDHLVRVKIPKIDNFDIKTTEQIYLEVPASLLKGVKEGSVICRDRLYIKNGKGTKEDPFSIFEARDFEALKLYPDKYFILEKTFDMKNYDWEPFEFFGTLIGNNKTIKNIYVKGHNDKPSGLFSILHGKVTDLNLVNITVSGGDNTGSIAGINKGIIDNCFIIGEISGDNNIGGITGKNEAGIVTKSNTMCTVSGKRNVGGIAGYVTEGTIMGCCAETLAAGSDSVGGIVGRVIAPGRITSCITTGGYIYISGTSLATAGRICGNPGSNTLFNNAATPDFQIMYLGTNIPRVIFGNAYNDNSLSHRHGENLNCSSSPKLSMESYCDTGMKTYPDTNEFFYYDLIYYGLNILIVLDNGIWIEDIIKSEQGIDLIVKCFKDSFRQSKAYASDLTIKPDNIHVYKNILIIDSEPIKQFRANDNFILDLSLPTSLITTWSLVENIVTDDGIPYLDVRGSKSSPYPVRTEKELWHFHVDPYSYYKLMNDIILYETDEWVLPDVVIGELNYNGYKIIKAEDIGKNPYLED